MASNDFHPQTQGAEELFVTLIVDCSKFLQLIPCKVCYTAVFSVVTQRSSPLEEHCVMTQKTAG